MHGDEVESVRLGGGQRQLPFAIVCGRIGEEVVEDSERQAALCDAHQNAHHSAHLQQVYVRSLYEHN